MNVYLVQNSDNLTFSPVPIITLCKDPVCIGNWKCSKTKKLRTKKNVAIFSSELVLSTCNSKSENTLVQHFFTWWMGDILQTSMTPDPRYCPRLTWNTNNGMPNKMESSRNCKMNVTRQKKMMHQYVLDTLLGLEFNIRHWNLSCLYVQ